MKITFLGTGTSQGVPIIGCDCLTCRSVDPRDKRLRTSAIIEKEDKKVLIDCGPDFRQQMLNNAFEKLDGVLITHEHNDHVIGMDDLRPLNFRQKINMPIFGSERTLSELKIRFSYAFDEKPYPGAPRLSLIPVLPGEEFEIENILIKPFEVMHGQLPILGFRMENLCYITDAKSIPEKSMEAIENCKVLVINALRYHDHRTHFTLNEALEFIKEINPQKAYLTHLSHLLPPYQKLEKELPENVIAAYDGLQITI